MVGRPQAGEQPSVGIIARANDAEGASKKSGFVVGGGWSSRQRKLATYERVSFASGTWGRAAAMAASGGDDVIVEAAGGKLRPQLRRSSVGRDFERACERRRVLEGVGFGRGTLEFQLLDARQQQPLILLRFHALDIRNH